VPAAQENDFERRVRESEQALLRGVPAGSRPPAERGWWLLVVTAQFWVRLVLWPFQDDHSRADGLLAGTGLVLLVVGVPLWLRGRRQAERRREEARAAGHRAAEGR